MIKRLLLLTLIASSFALGYGAMSHAAFPVFGRNAFYGYYNNVFDSSGGNILPSIYDGNANAIPNYVDTAAELISFIESQFNGSGQQRIGAGFIIDTMLGGNHSYPPTGAQMAQWESDIYYYEAIGGINWSLAFNYSVNSMYQGSGSGPNPNDDTFFAASGTSASITFTSGGWIHYGIRRQCANPVGTGGLTTLDHKVFTESGHTTVSNASPSPGDTVTFRHYLKNEGPNGTWPTSVWWIAEQTSPGFFGVGGPANDGFYDPGAERNVFTHNVTIPANAAAGTQYCERVGWDPVTSDGVHNGRGTPACATVALDYALTPTITLTVNGSAPTSGSVAEVGDQLAFSYVVGNAGPGPSGSVSCTIYGLTKPGPYTAPNPADSTSDGGYAQPAHGCPRSFNVGSTTLVTETFAVPGSSLNKTICRSLYVNPASGSGGSANTESCIRIGAKPYVRSYGGDVSAGNGLTNASGTCASNAQAAIVSWNRGSTNGYAGAGVQYAAMALSKINDFSSTLGSAGAPVPSGLTFANTAPSGTNFGGNFGSLPCIPDHYATKPATTLPITADVGSMTTGSYRGSGAVSLAGGSVNPSERISAYIDGDVYITSNITYSGSWSVATMPLFRLVVRGNIYIDNDVSQLDGLYVAQRNAGSGGTIYTCTTGAAALAPSDPSFFAQCDNQKLTVNGAFVANQVQLGRTSGTLSQADAAQTGASGFSAEVFNFSPIMWIPQPTGGAGSSDYDSITTLPPVL